MTPDQAEALAARTLAAIDHGDHSTPQRCRAADRERVESDLAGLREADALADALAVLLGDVREVWTARHLRDRYAADLRRTAALYGQAEPRPYLCACPPSDGPCAVHG